MTRVKTFRRWLIVAFAVLLTAPVAGSLFSTKTASALAVPVPLTASYTINVQATFTGGATAPGADSISFDGQTLNAVKSSSSGSTTTYTAAATVNFESNKVPQLQACSSVLNNECSSKFYPAGGQHATVNISGSTGNPGTGGSSDTASQSSSPTCETSNDPMSWILCPIFNGAADFSDFLLHSIIVPFLITSPISTSPGDPIYQVWSNFRLYGDIFLVIALIILVFGEAIGGGLVDAYTVKKAMPRVLAAAIFVNLSIYIMAFAIDVTNIVGSSIGNILIEPFKTAGNWHFSPNGVQGVGVLSIGLIGLFLAKSGILQTLSALFFPPKGSHAETALKNNAGGESFLKIALWAGILIAVPMLLAILAMFVTLIIRQGIILFFVLASPILFALYALPNTEGTARRGGKIFIETLMVYPIVIIVFAISDILSITILDANKINPTNLGSVLTSSFASIIAIVVAFILQFLPLFLGPFAFRMAGGTFGKLHEMVAGAHNKITNMSGYKHAREHATQEFQDRKVQAGNRMHQNWLDRANSQDTSTAIGRFRQRRWEQAARAGGGKHIEERIAELNKRESERRQANTNFGPDNMRRASTINGDMLHMARRGGVQALRNSGYVEGQDYREVQDAQGNRHLELASLGGSWYGMATATQAAREYAGNEGALQENLTYEMSKATTEAEKSRIVNRYGSWAQSQGWGRNTANERWIGSAYGMQQKDKNYKYYRVGADGNLGPLNALGQITEMNREQGSWEWGKFSAQTYNDLSKNVSLASDVLQGRVAQGGMFEDDTTPGGQTGRQKAEQYLQEVGKHVHFLESASPSVDPQTGQPLAGGGRSMLYGAAPETSQAAQALANNFHNRAGTWQNRLEDEGPHMPQDPTVRVGNSTEEQVSSVGGPSAGQVPRNPNNVTAENPGGIPETAVPGHIYPDPRIAGVETGTGLDDNSYTRWQNGGPGGAATLIRPARPAAPGGAGTAIRRPGGPTRPPGGPGGPGGPPGGPGPGRP